MKVQTGPGDFAEGGVESLVLQAMLSGVALRPKSLGVTAKELMNIQKSLREGGLYSPALREVYQASMRKPVVTVTTRNEQEDT